MLCSQVYAVRLLCSQTVMELRSGLAESYAARRLLSGMSLQWNLELGAQ